MTLFLSLSLSLSGCEDNDTPDTGIPSIRVKNISALESFELISEDTEGDITIIDIRTPAEYSQAKIPGSIIIDFYSPDFRNSLRLLDKEKPYLIYCRSGSRSSHAMRIFQEKGFATIFHMDGGIVDWVNQRLPLED